MNFRFTDTAKIILIVGATLVVAVGIYRFLFDFTAASEALSPDKGVPLRLEAWKTVAQFVGALVVAYGLYWTARNVRATESNAEIARTNTDIARQNSEIARKSAESDLEVAHANLEVARDAKLVERYIKAVEMLSRTGIEFIGGVLALERLARESPRDHWPIMEILMMVTRQKLVELGGNPITPEVQSLLTAFGRRRRDQDVFALEGSERHVKERKIDLSGLTISRANFRSLDFQGAVFTSTIFQDCDFQGSSLQNATFVRSKFNGCYLGYFMTDSAADCSHANFASVVFENTYLTKARFDHAVLINVKFGPRRTATNFDPNNDPYSVEVTGTSFRQANMQGAYFVPGAELAETDFTDADMKNVGFRGINASQAVGITEIQREQVFSSDQTRWPQMTTTSLQEDVVSLDAQQDES